MALSFAIAGAAVAGTDAGTSAITKNKVKKIAKKQAKKQIARKAPNLSVANATNANNAANLGGQPPSAFLPASGVRFARINGDGTVVAAQSRGIAQANVSKDGTGDYCINGLNPAPRSVSATLDWDAPFEAQIFARLPADLSGHCQGQQLAISTYNSANTATDMPIYVVIF